MATAKAFQKCALVIGVLSTIEQRRDEVISVLESHFGPVEQQSPVMDFSFTDYYDSEMGSRPVRYLLLFRDLVDTATLADLKSITNGIEMDFASSDGKRKVNLDPGILSLSSFILATCKDRSHRIPLRDGIYAETTLIYKNHDFQSLDWTYADYRSDAIRAVLRSFRSWYKAKLQQIEKN